METIDVIVRSAALLSDVWSTVCSPQLAKGIKEVNPEVREPMTITKQSDVFDI